MYYYMLVCTTVC